jgi:GAF domain
MAMTASLRTGGPARISGDMLTSGPFDEVVHGLGPLAAMATPIVVEGRFWGRDRVAARGEPPETVFAAATSEALQYFGGGTARMIRYETDGTVTLLANEGTTGPHVRSAVALPIHVDGRLWGAIAVGSGQGPLPDGTEHRMMEFTDLVATAVANTQNRAALEASRDELSRLVAEQAALRRVATMVACGTDPARSSRRSPRKSAGCSPRTAPLLATMSRMGPRS